MLVLVEKRIGGYKQRHSNLSWVRDGAGETKALRATKGGVMAAAVENVYALDVGDVPVLTFAATTFREAQSFAVSNGYAPILPRHTRTARLYGTERASAQCGAQSDETARFHCAIAEAVDDSGTLFGLPD